MKVNHVDRIKSMLEEERNKAQRDKIIDYVGNDEDRFHALFEIFSDKTLHWRFNQWAAWPMGYIGRKHPELIIPYVEEMVEMLENPVHDAVPRNILRILEDIDIPEVAEGPLFDKCFGFLNDTKKPIAMRVFSMTILFRIGQKYPETLDEIAEAISIHLPQGSAGFKNRGQKIINKIRSMR